jgi:hypothetical protein
MFLKLEYTEIFRNIDAWSQRPIIYFRNLRFFCAKQ